MILFIFILRYLGKISNLRISISIQLNSIGYSIYSKPHQFHKTIRSLNISINVKCKIFPILVMPLYTNVPIDDPELYNQTELTTVSQEKYENYFLPHPSNLFEKIARFILFFVTLGPIRMICTILCFLVFISVMPILNLFKKNFKTPREYKVWAQKILYPIARLGLFFLGVMHIKKTGNIEPNTRTIVVNHLTMFDIVVVISLFDSSYLAMAGLKNLFFMKSANEIFNMVYVDRTKEKQGTTELICRLQNDYSRVPIVIFPEGKVTNGDCLLGFRTGAFVNDTPIQGMTFRYKLWFCSKGQSTIAWVDPSDIFYLWQLYTIPFMTLEVNCLPQVSFQGSNKTPAEKAEIVELMMANSLGCLALKQTNKEYFEKHKND